MVGSPQAVWEAGWVNAPVDPAKPVLNTLSGEASGVKRMVDGGRWTERQRGTRIWIGGCVLSTVHGPPSTVHHEAAPQVSRRPVHRRGDQHAVAQGLGL